MSEAENNESASHPNLDEFLLARHEQHIANYEAAVNRDNFFAALLRENDPSNLMLVLGGLFPENPEAPDTFKHEQFNYHLEQPTSITFMDKEIEVGQVLFRTESRDRDYSEDAAIFVDLLPANIPELPRDYFETGGDSGIATVLHLLFLPSGHFDISWEQAALGGKTAAIEPLDMFYSSVQHDSTQNQEVLDRLVASLRGKATWHLLLSD